MKRDKEEEIMKTFRGIVLGILFAVLMLYSFSSLMIGIHNNRRDYFIRKGMDFR
jgi:peptidoglycan biosynthesis protein MviN/MurJ (putative lipid II flippase)